MLHHIGGPRKGGVRCPVASAATPIRLSTRPGVMRARRGTTWHVPSAVAGRVMDLDISIMDEILQGGYDKLNEAGATLVGGHTLSNKELMYGLAVTGTIHPKRIVTNANARVGDKLVLTKPLGTGIIATAQKCSHSDQSFVQVSSEILNEANEVMATLNEQASRVMKEIGVHSCTDITGFGLLGHLYEMVIASKIGAVIHVKDLPVLNGVSSFAEKGICSGAAYRNEAYLREKITFIKNVTIAQKRILHDAQTSGGLLISLSSDKTNTLLSMLNKVDSYEAKIIGEAIQPPDNNTVIIVE